MILKSSFEKVDMGNDEIIAVPVGKEAYQINGVLKLNKVGLEIFDMLKEYASADEIIEKLSQKYDNNRDTISEYVMNVIEVLKINDIIEI